ncbi:hypothetical protein SAMN05444161_2148 [Rhizobiales bacterium GAS191]|nr:hypothetical protein SAMN05444161_2148 [Rhizobiales bacterium GAS191]
MSERTFPPARRIAAVCGERLIHYFKSVHARRKLSPAASHRDQGGLVRHVTCFGRQFHKVGRMVPILSRFLHGNFYPHSDTAGTQLFKPGSLFWSENSLPPGGHRVDDQPERPAEPVRESYTAFGGLEGNHPSPDAGTAVLGRPVASNLNMRQYVAISLGKMSLLGVLIRASRSPGHQDGVSEPWGLPGRPFPASPARMVLSELRVEAASSGRASRSAAARQCRERQKHQRCNRDQSPACFELLHSQPPVTALICAGADGSNGTTAFAASSSMASTMYAE